MKRILPAITCILVIFFAFSCKSTGTSAVVDTEPRPAAKPTPAPAPSPRVEPGPVPVPPPKQEEVSPAPIYERYGDTIILTGAKDYTVVWGDTLSKIARKNYGAGDNGYYFPLIIAASRINVDIKDPDKIRVGIRLRIPNLQANLDDPRARDNLKNLLMEIADFYSRKPGRQSRGLHNGLIRLYNTL
jgi:hypothetical protein